MLAALLLPALAAAEPSGVGCCAGSLVGKGSGSFLPPVRTLPLPPTHLRRSRPSRRCVAGPVQGRVGLRHLQRWPVLRRAVLRPRPQHGLVTSRLPSPSHPNPGGGADCWGRGEQAVPERQGLVHLDVGVRLQEPRQHTEHPQPLHRTQCAAPPPACPDSRDALPLTGLDVDAVCAQPGSSRLTVATSASPTATPSSDGPPPPATTTASSSSPQPATPNALSPPPAAAAQQKAVGRRHPRVGGRARVRLATILRGDILRRAEDQA
eukprot:COSAG04_NODE_6885_length_1234_cov_1.635242_1_plen_265_part_00